MMIRQRVLAFGAMLLLTVFSAGSAIAQTTTPGTFLPKRSNLVANTTTTLIPDYDPSLAGGVFPAVNVANTSFSTVTITAQDLVDAGDNGQEIVDVFFTIEGLTHSHVSDLTVDVAYTPVGGTSPTRTATLFERAGISNPGTNGFVDNQNGDGIGSSANLDGSYRFGDNGTQLFAAAATGTPDGSVITTVNQPTTNATIYNATGATDQLVSLFQAFATDGAGNALTLTDIIGTYTFGISDRSNQTTDFEVNGTAQSFTETNVAFQTAPTSAIPEPGTTTAMLLGMIGFAARRRRA